jgi:hypothetical protein
MGMFWELGLTSCRCRGSGSFGLETKSNDYLGIRAELGLTSCRCRGSGSFGLETKSNDYLGIRAELCFGGMFQLVKGVGLGRSGWSLEKRILEIVCWLYI